MEESRQAAASSSSSVADGGLIGNEEAATSLPTAVLRGDGSSDEAWFDDDCDNDLELHNEWKLRRDKLYNDGYREGIIEGQKDSAQDGFNHGFRDSVRVGYNWGIVRGITSALAHLPDELRAKLVESHEIRKEFLNLQEHVDSITTEDALKLFSDTIKREKPAEESSSVESEPSLIHPSDCGGLETQIAKLGLLLKESPAINVGLGLFENAGS